MPPLFRNFYTAPYKEVTAMNKFEEMVWQIKCKYHKTMMHWYVIFGRPDKVDQEYQTVMRMIDAYYSTFLEPVSCSKKD